MKKLTTIHDLTAKVKATGMPASGWIVSDWKKDFPPALRHTEYWSTRHGKGTLIRKATVYPRKSGAALWGRTGANTMRLG